MFFKRNDFEITPGVFDVNSRFQPVPLEALTISWICNGSESILVQGVGETVLAGVTEWFTQIKITSGTSGRSFISRQQGIVRGLGFD
jgi:hypothetical protein